MPTLITPLLNAECLGGSDISPEKHELREIAWRGNLSPLQVLGFKKLDSKIIKKKPALQINPEWALRNEDGKAQIESDLEETIDTRLYSIYSEESFQNYQQTQSDMECALEKLDETFEIKANENLYFVENISTKTKAKSPAIARNLAIASARRDGFLILLTRLQLDLATADQISDEEISDMVSSEQIQDEKYAGNNYSAIFNITYAKNFVDHILKQKKTISTKSYNPFSNDDNTNMVASGSSIIIAGINNNNRITLWENDNLWRYALTRYLGSKAKKNYIIIQPKVDDISQINVNYG